MATRRLFGLCLLLGTLGSAHQAQARPPVGVDGAQVPEAHLKMLAGGLVKLLREVEENTLRLDGQGERMAVEVEQAYRAVKTLFSHSFLAGRTHRQARKDLQVMTARGDQVEMTVQELHTGLGLVEEDQGVLEHRMAQIHQKLQEASEGEMQQQVNAVQMKIKVTADNQARRLVTLASQVIARDKMINRHLRSIEDLEKQLYDLTGGKPHPP